MNDGMGVGYARLDSRHINVLRTEAQMSEIEWRLETRCVNDLLPTQRNPRRITRDQMAQLKRSVEKFGLIDKPIVDIHDRIICGHRRVEICQDRKTIECWVPNRELTEDEVRELNIRHNANHGEWDFDMLANEFDQGELMAWGLDLLESEEEKPAKKTKPKATFEFDSNEDLESVAEAIQTAALEWGAKLKVKA